MSFQRNNRDMKAMNEGRIKNHFKRDEDYFYTENPKPEWLINRVIAICKYRPDALGIVYDYPDQQDGISVSVDIDDIGYCGDRIGTFNYCSSMESLKEAFCKIKDYSGNDYSEMAASQIWELSEKLSIPLGKYAAIVFERMINRKGVKCLEDEKQ